MSYQEKKIILSKEELGRTIKRLAHEIVEENFGVKDLVIIGIQTRGVFLAQRIIKEIIQNGLADGEKELPFGKLDINLYRDDVDSMKKLPEVKETDIPFEIDGKKIVLVDDVIFTGRSIRAAHG